MDNRKTRSSKIKKTTVTPEKKKTTKKKTKKKAFTLIELLAVIIILGILMIIAIPSVTSYINNSRKSGYVTTAKNLMDGARTKVNEGKISFYDTSTTYYIPYDMIKTENSSKSPYGEFKEAYVVVTYDGSNFDYYWTSIDDTNTGFYLTYYDNLSNDKIVSNMDKVSKEIAICGKENIIVYNASGSISETNEAKSCINAHNNYDGSGQSNANIPEPVSFSTDSWETISNAIKNGNTTAYHIGDLKSINLGALGTHDVRIANMSTPVECNNSNFSQTSCGFVLEFVDILENRVMNSTKTSAGGWEASEIRSYLNGEFYNNLPKDLREIIITTNVISGSESSNIANYKTKDKVFLLAYKELYNSKGNELLNETRQLDFYQNSGTTTSNKNNVIKKYNNVNSAWWLRSGITAYYNYYFSIMYDGGGTYYTSKSANEQFGISPAFRIG